LKEAMDKNDLLERQISYLKKNDSPDQSYGGMKNDSPKKTKKGKTLVKAIGINLSENQHSESKILTIII
jgi:hypothetical protein